MRGAATHPAGAKRLADHWGLVAGAVAGLTVCNGPVLFFTAGVFLKPIAADMHWARSTVSFALSFAVFLSAVATPVFGRMMDRRGVRAILTPGVAAFAASLGALALSPDLPGAFSRWPRSQASSARLRRRRPTPRRFRRRSTSAVASRSGSQWQG